MVTKDAQFADSFKDFLLPLHRVATAYSFEDDRQWKPNDLCKTQTKPTV